MNLVDEQDVAPPQPGEDAGQIGAARQRRSGDNVNLRAHLVGDDMRQRRLAQSRRAVQKHVLHRLAAAAGSGDGNPQLLEQLLLPDVVGETPRTQRVREVRLLRVARVLGGNDPFSGHVAQRL